jgi:cytochrome c peroxidase
MNELRTVLHCIGNTSLLPLHSLTMSNLRSNRRPHRNRFLSVALVFSLVAIVVAAQEARVPVASQMLSVTAWLGLPVSPSSGNIPAEQDIALGRRLFFDPLLSGNNKFSCATCHKPQFAYADDKP